VDLSSADLVGLLKDAANRLEDDNAIAIADSSTFNLLYSVLRRFETFDHKAQELTCSVIIAAVKGISRGCKRALVSSASDEDLSCLRSALLMAIFLLGWLVQEAEKFNAKAGLMPSAVRAKKGAKTIPESKGRYWEDLREPAALRLLEVRLIATP
jgi:hypothetical protein